MDFRKHLRRAQKQNRRASGVKSNMTSEIKRAYQILELELGASLEQVKQAWREQVKVWHPDRFPNDAKMQRKAQERLKDINGAYELLCQFLADGTSPRGGHTNSSNTKNERDQKSKEAKTERGEPPSPPGESFKRPKKSKAKVVCLFILAAGVLAYCASLAVHYSAFARQLTQIKGIQIGDSRDEVRYRLGIPQEVLGAVIDDKEYKGFQLVYTVNAPTNNVNRMPPTTKIEDYNEWVYEEPNSNFRLTVEFNKSGLAESIDLYSDADKSYVWGSIAGIYCGDSEEKVLQLGKPSEQHLDGVSKTIEYRDIGVEVALTKGRAYMIKIKGPQSKMAVFLCFLRSYF
jgi:outer membrane protein assembly factor BamE (lipoprotein component of BamABCDE complex)